MVDLPDNKCTGCQACREICPTHSIRFEKNKDGFLYPKIDIETCINCSACNKICPAENMQLLYRPKQAYAVVANDKCESLTSASGGACTILSQAIIQNGGVVYGSSMLNYQNVKHIRIDSIEALSKLKGSKYVQSDLTNIYHQIKDDLSENTQVLFIGTPCQVAGLRSYLRKDYSNLFTIDLICHGVPSLCMLESFVKEKCKTPHPSIKVIFRWKVKDKNSPVRFGSQFINTSGKIERSVPSLRNSFMAAFFSGISYRENCHECKYACIERVSDITVGDFWGLGGKIKTALDLSAGVSLILINSLKGNELFNAIKGKIVYEEHSIEDAVLNNANLRRPTPRPKEKDLFFQKWHMAGLENAAEKYVPDYARNKKLSRRIYLNIATNLSKISFISRLRNQKN